MRRRTQSTPSSGSSHRHRILNRRTGASSSAASQSEDWVRLITRRSPRKKALRRNSTKAEELIQKQDYAGAEPLAAKAGATRNDPANYVAWFELGFVENGLGKTRRIDCGVSQIGERRSRMCLNRT